MLHLAALVLVGFVALEHLLFLVLESFLWQTPTGRKIFMLSREEAEITAPLAKNQGLYNGFLAAGLVWSLVHPDPVVARSLQIFFLACVIVAGIVGALTAKRTILFVQGLPAAIALALVAAS